ncbi:hypothetical protein D3C76_1773610 [compost metagenome]
MQFIGHTILGIAAARYWRHDDTVGEFDGTHAGGFEQVGPVAVVSHEGFHQAELSRPVV